MRKTVYCSTAIRTVLLLLAAVCLLTVYPLRLWSRYPEVGIDSGQQAASEASAPVDEDHDIVQRFVAGYDRLARVRVYLKGFDGGRYLNMTLLDSDGVPLYTKIYDCGEGAENLFLEIPAGVRLTVGEEYSLHFGGCLSSYHLGVMEIAPEDAAASHLGGFYYHDTGVAERVLAVSFVYKQPVSREQSLFAGAVIAAVFAGLYLLVTLLFRGVLKERDRLFTVSQVIRAVLLPLILLSAGILLVQIVPLLRFDDRPGENAFLAAGVVLTALLALWAVRDVTRDCTRTLPADASGAADAQNREGEALPVTAYAVVVLLALLLQTGCEYMNGLFDIHHQVAERRMTAVFLLMLVLMRGKRGALRELRLRGFGWLTLLFLLLICLFRNTRWWGVALSALYLLFYLRLGTYRGKDRWMEILSRGIALHFASSVVYCLLHRVFTGFMVNRYPMMFHTVTVTAEYLTIVTGVLAAVVLTNVRQAYERGGVRGLLRGSVPWFALFGVSASYAVFTLSRTAYLSIVVLLFVLLVFCALATGRRLRAGGNAAGFPAIRAFGVYAGVLLLSLVCAFPATFALQRTLPSLYGDPVVFPVEEMPLQLRGATNPDNRYYMSLARFTDLFRSKILGMEESSTFLPEDRYNYNPDGSFRYWRNGASAPEEEQEEARWRAETAGDAGGTEASDTLEESGTAAEEAPAAEEEGAAKDPASGEEEETDAAKDDGEETYTLVDRLDAFSNGRITIFRSYLREMNLTGHEIMGAPLPDGHLAVHAHNTLLQVAFDHGVPAGILFAVWMCAALFCAVRYDRRRQAEAVAAARGGVSLQPTLVPAALAMSFLLTGISEWVFHLCNPVTIAFMLGTGVLVFRDEKKYNDTV